MRTWFWNKFPGLYEKTWNLANKLWVRRFNKLNRKFEDMHKYRRTLDALDPHPRSQSYDDYYHS